MTLWAETYLELHQAWNLKLHACLSSYRCTCYHTTSYHSPKQVSNICQVCLGGKGCVCATTIGHGCKVDSSGRASMLFLGVIKWHCAKYPLDDRRHDSEEEEHTFAMDRYLTRLFRMMIDNSKVVSRCLAPLFFCTDRHYHHHHYLHRHRQTSET